MTGRWVGALCGTRRTSSDGPTQQLSNSRVRTPLSPHVPVCTRTQLARADHVRVMLDLKGPDVLQVLRKNPHLLCMEAQVARARYNALHKVLHLSHESIKSLVHKFPLVLNYQTATVEEIVDSLRQVCSMRLHWQEDFENVTPSTLAFFIRCGYSLRVGGG